MTRALWIALMTLAAAVIAALITRRRPEAVARWDESDEGIDPWDCRTVTLAAVPPAGWTWHSDNPEPVAVLVTPESLALALRAMPGRYDAWPEWADKYAAALRALAAKLREVG